MSFTPVPLYPRGKCPPVSLEGIKIFSYTLPFGCDKSATSFVLYLQVAGYKKASVQTFLRLFPVSQFIFTAQYNMQMYHPASPTLPLFCSF
jgi:hypothetical protein